MLLGALGLSLWGDVWDGATKGLAALSGDSDVLYPDNARRKNRVSELSGDISYFGNKMKDAKFEMKSVLRKLGQKYSAYFEQKEYDFGSWAIKTNENFGQVLNLEDSVKCLLLGGLFADDSISDRDELLSASNLPLCVTIFKVYGVPVLPTASILGAAVSGSMFRDKLREAIRERVQARRELLKFKLTLDFLLEQFKSLEGKDDLLSIGYKEADIRKAMKEEIRKIRNGIENFPAENKARSWLRELDSERKSWTIED